MFAPVKLASYITNGIHFGVSLICGDDAKFRSKALRVTVTYEIEQDWTRHRHIYWVAEKKITEVDLGDGCVAEIDALKAKQDQ